MIKFFRNLSFGWIIIGMALIVAVAGLGMISGAENGRTWLCASVGCKLVQGITLFGMSGFMLVVGVMYLLRR